MTAVALANKNARVMWALLIRNQSYRPQPPEKEKLRLKPGGEVKMASTSKPRLIVSAPAHRQRLRAQSAPAYAGLTATGARAQQRHPPKD